MVDQCGNCTFYEATAMVCRAFAPRAVYSQLQTFPHLKPEDWCGDYLTATAVVGSCSVCFFYESTLSVCRYNAPFSAEQPEIFAYVKPDQWCGNYSTGPKVISGGGEASAAYELASQGLATARNAWIIGNQALATASGAWVRANAAYDLASAALSTASSAWIRLNTWDSAWIDASGTTTCTAATGNITNYSILFARYYRVGKICHFAASIDIPDNGTGSGSLRCSIPVPLASGIETAGAGNRSTDNKMLRVFCNGTNPYFIIRLYDGTYPAASGDDLSFSISYAIA